MFRSTLVLLLATLVAGLVALPGEAMAAPGSPGSPDYRIGVDDILQVMVRPRTDLSTQTQVLADGNISLPSIGAVKAEGLTVSQLQQELNRRFGLYDRDITQVTLIVIAYNSQRVFVLGEVYKPGRYSFPAIPGIWDVVREAGGPSPEADLTSVQVIRGEGEARQTLSVDLGTAINTGDFSGLPSLRPGDTVRLSRKTTAVSLGDQVLVMGGVKNPGIYSTQQATTLMAAIMAAGGPEPGAGLDHVMLTRHTGEASRTVELNLEEYLDGGKWNSNLALKPGDAVQIPVRRSGVQRGLFSLNFLLPSIQAILSAVLAVESIRISANR